MDTAILFSLFQFFDFWTIDFFHVIESKCKKSIQKLIFQCLEYQSVKNKIGILNWSNTNYLWFHKTFKSHLMFLIQTFQNIIVEGCLNTHEFSKFWKNLQTFSSQFLFDFNSNIVFLTAFSLFWNLSLYNYIQYVLIPNILKLKFSSISQWKC